MGPMVSLVGIQMGVCGLDLLSSNSNEMTNLKPTQHISFLMNFPTILIHHRIT